MPIRPKASNKAQLADRIAKLTRCKGIKMSQKMTKYAVRRISFNMAALLGCSKFIISQFLEKVQEKQVPSREKQDKGDKIQTSPLPN